MSYRKLIATLVFAAFGICFSGAATAQDCNNPDFCFDFGIPVTVDNFTGSKVSCVLDPGGASQPFNTLEIGLGGFNSNTGTFTQTGTATCTKVPDPPANPISLGSCTFDLEWKGVTISSCNPKSHSFNASLLCQNIGGENGPTVTGTITCPTSGDVIQLFIPGIDNCTDVFPADDNFSVAGQVLDLTVTTKGVCTGPFVSISNVKERYCNGGFNNDLFGFNNQLFDCGPVGNTRTTDPATTVLPSVVAFDFDVRQTVNTKCQGNKQGNVNIDILGSAYFAVANVDTSSLSCGASLEKADLAPLFHCMIHDKNHDGFPDLACKADACPNFAPGLAELLKNPDGTVTATCTGKLMPLPEAKSGTGTGILGSGDVKVTTKK